MSPRHAKDISSLLSFRFHFHSPLYPSYPSPILTFLSLLFLIPALCLESLLSSRFVVRLQPPLPDSIFHFIPLPAPSLGLDCPRHRLELDRSTNTSITSTISSTMSTISSVITTSLPPLSTVMVEDESTMTRWISIYFCSRSSSQLLRGDFQECQKDIS